jgi:hypothetical protein
LLSLSLALSLSAPLFFFSLTSQLLLVEAMGQVPIFLLIQKSIGAVLAVSKKKVTTRGTDGGG